MSTMDDESGATVPVQPACALEAGERPPYDSDAT
jgi:hypothetical protein